MPLRIAALTSGEMSASTLWTLKQLYSAGHEDGHELVVIKGLRATDIPRRKRLKRLRREYGIFHVISRMLGGYLFGQSAEKRAEVEFNALFDGDSLSSWWSESGAELKQVSHLNGPDSREFLTEWQPDLIIRVSGGILRSGTFELANLATLNIHHGLAPAIRGMWSIPWGLLEGRADWIGATIHKIDSGIDTGDVFWRGGPQLAMGDTGNTLFYRTHLMAVEALTTVVDTFAQGESPTTLSYSGDSAYRTAPGVWNWIRYLALGEGRRAEIVLRSAIE